MEYDLHGDCGVRFEMPPWESRVFRILIVLFVLLPIIELTLIFKLGTWIGWIPTLLLVFGAGLAGAAIARMQGFMAAVRVRQLGPGVNERC